MTKTRDPVGALVIIDLQNDFCHPDGVYGRLGRDLASINAMAPRLDAVARAWRAAGSPVVHVRTEHSDDTDSAAWLARAGSALPRACRAGSWGADPFLDIIDAADHVVVKTRYSGFHRTRLEPILTDLGVDEVVVTGVLTNVCVETTIREGCLRDFSMVLLEDCCGTYDEHLHQASVENVRRYFGTVRSSTGRAPETSTSPAVR